MASLDDFIITSSSMYTVTVHVHHANPTLFAPFCLDKVLIFSCTEQYSLSFYHLLFMNVHSGLSKLAAATGEFGLVLKPGEFVSLGNAKESWSEDFHLLERYGHSVVILDLLLDYLFNEFVDLYHLQSESPPRTFTNLSDMLESLPVNFTELCQISFTDYLKQKDIPDDLVDELVSATVQAVYNQDGRLITALSGMVSLARSANDKYWSVLGGNEILCPHLLSKTNATLHLNSPVTEIMYVSSAGLAVTYQETLTSLQESMYNAVILATPLPSSGIQLKGFPQPVPALNPGIYQKTTTTLVKGDVNLTYFGLDVDADVPWLFGMPASNDIPISLIELTPPVDGSATQGKPVWKVQSTDSLLKTPANLQFLNMLFPNCTATEHTFVNAYPHFTSPDSLGPLVLGEGLFYSSGIEWAGSAMEMSCISAKNSALSLVRFLHSVFSS